MTASRRTFLQSAAALAAAQSGHAAAAPLDAVAIARRHPLVRTQPTPVFLEGLLLGNGDIGACVTVRPDAFGVHIGKNDSWDIRVSEDHAAHILPFREVLALWEKASAEAKRQGHADMTQLQENIDFFRRYTEKMASSYRKPWPRPWPCGVVWLHWDARQVRVVKQELDIATGMLTVQLEVDDLRGKVQPARVLCFVSREEGHLVVAADAAVPISSVAYYPYSDGKALMPEPVVSDDQGAFACRQDFPANAPAGDKPGERSEKDRSFALHAMLSGGWVPEPGAREQGHVLMNGVGGEPFRLDLTLFTTADQRDNAGHARREAQRLHATPLPALVRRSAGQWAEFWSKSAVEFEDKELEALWYRNQYFLACCLKPGKTAPGLFGNWTSGNIGTAWHGDYHMNYNTQQVWWGVFSSNHVEQHEPYTRLVESLMPMAEWNARVQFGLPGAYFPHSAFPVPSQVNPYPAAPWGYEICETPWTVQSLWWQYRYTLDEAYLRRVYPMLRAATDFLVAFVSKGADGKYHVIPTVSPENWGCTVDFRLNKDCIIDLALIEFLLDAMLEGSQALGLDAALRPRWQEVRRNLAPYPEVDGPYGKVWLDVVDAPAEFVYNVPVTLAPVFPAEQVGLGSSPALLELARRTTRTVRLEGGNDLVWQPLVRARLGMLDLDWFKREVRYSMTALGVANDRIRQIGGRYRDRTNFDFMMPMGVWTENLSLPAVLNECMMQSCGGVIRLFPNTLKLAPARFRDLRATGAFLVSAAWDGRVVSDVSIRSEKGSPARVANPWPGRKAVVRRVDSGAVVAAVEREGALEFSTDRGAAYTVVAGA
jgi:alpha-L-fucosidase 2